jgi:hypothetical protein
MLKLGKLGCFNPDSPPDGIWGTFAPGLKVQVRKLTSEVIKETRKKYVTITMEVDTKSRAMVPVEHVDDEKYEEAMTDYLIQDFTKSFTDEDDVPLPVNLDSKKRMFNNLPLKDWIWAFAQTLEMADVKKLEEEGKNS